jgi:ribose transport system ATP-binding protein
VLRDGEYIADKDISEIDKDWLISNMIGRDLKDTFPKRDRAFTEDVVMEADKLTNDRFQEVSFRLRKGEILGLTGLVGAGRSEVLRAIFGADKLKSGKIKLFGREVTINHPNKAVALGMGFALEDRKAQGLFLNQDICRNITISAQDKVSKKGFIQSKKEKALAQKHFDEMRVVSPDIYKICKFLSGGNQQKVVLAKWLATDCKILFLDEPTRGIDVGAKYEIYVLMNKLVQKGVSIIMISSEMPEVMAMADRIIVMHEGRITGELNYEDIKEEKIMKLASGETLT